MSLPSMHFGPLVSLFCWRLLLSRSFDACSQACFFSPARFCRICPDRRVVLALCFRSASAVKAVGVDGSATQPLFPRHLRPLSFCGTTVSPLPRRLQRTPSGGRGAWRSGPSSSSLLLFPPSHGGRALTDSTEIEYPHLGRLRIKKYISVGKFIFSYSTSSQVWIEIPRGRDGLKCSPKRVK